MILLSLRASSIIWPIPERFLRLLASRANAVFIWTHFFLEEAMPAGDVRRNPFSGKVETKIIEGHSGTLLRTQLPARQLERVLLWWYEGSAFLDA